MYFPIKLKSGKYVSGDSKRFQSAFVGVDKLKKFLPSDCNVRGNANTLDVSMVNQFVDFNSKFNNMGFLHRA